MSEINNTPPISFDRDANGLLKHLQYHFAPDGRINWQKMFLPEHLYVKPQYEKKVQELYGKPVKELDPIKDDINPLYLASTLAGARYLAWVRGMTSVTYDIRESNPSYAAVNCRMYFIENYEGGAAEYSDCGNASSDNTESFMRLYVLEAATNRAFARTVRAALNISIVSREEIVNGGPEQVGTTESGSLKEEATDIKSLVKKELKARGYSSFEDSKEVLLKAGAPEVIKDMKFKDLDNSLLFTLLAILKGLPMV